MKIFLAGIMQGSIKGKGIQEQDYRELIQEAVKTNHPDAEIIDPFSLFPDSVEYDDHRSKKVLFAMAADAGTSDIVIAYLPEASLGTALEMIRAYDNKKTVICISPMEKNWFIRAVSKKVFPSLDDFLSWVSQTQLGELINTAAE
ncbi:MAG: hypothetical protein WBB69_06105 [Anaerolineales bacterium]